MILSQDSVLGCYEKAPTSKPEISTGRPTNNRHKKGKQ